MIEPSNTLSRVASWVIRNRETGEVIAETFSRRKVAALNAAQYEAVPIAEYLASLKAKPLTFPPRPLAKLTP